MGRKRLYTPEEAYNRICERAKQRLIKHQDYRLYQLTKSKCKRLGIEFNLELSDFKIPDTCKYLGVPLTNIMGTGRVPTNASIDRIDNSLGYSPTNCRIIPLSSQSSNRTTNHKILYNGSFYTVAELSRLLNVKSSTLYSRLRRNGRI